MSTPSPSEQLPSANSFHDRYTQINERIRQAAEKSGRLASDVCLLAVTKTVDSGRICEAAALGIHDFGENKVQEALAKRPHLQMAGEPLKVAYHMIGTLQSNKAGRAVELFDVIQSVDRPKLASMINRNAGEMGKCQRCLVEVKISSEPSKSGIPLVDAELFIKSFRDYKNLKLQGLMTIGELDATAEQTRQSFRQLNKFFQEQRESFGENPILSMGMSDDFEMAIEEGSTMVRIGRALFGERRTSY